MHTAEKLWIPKDWIPKIYIKILIFWICYYRKIYSKHCCYKILVSTPKRFGGCYIYLENFYYWLRIKISGVCSTVLGDKDEWAYLEHVIVIKTGSFFLHSIQPNRDRLFLVCCCCKFLKYTKIPGAHNWTESCFSCEQCSQIYPIIET